MRPSWSSSLPRRQPVKTRPAVDGAKKDGDKVERGATCDWEPGERHRGQCPAPKTTDGPKTYPRYIETRVALVADNQHLYCNGVLAVPIFCMVIEFMGS